MEFALIVCITGVLGFLLRGNNARLSRRLENKGMAACVKSIQSIRVELYSFLGLHSLEV